MLQLPQTGAGLRVVRPDAVTDPIFNLIKIHKTLQATSAHLCDRLSEAEFNALKVHGRRPSSGGQAWDKKVGVTLLCREYARAEAAEKRHTALLVKTGPTTPAGAGALLEYILSDDLCDDDGYWHGAAIKTVAAALADMG